MSNKELPLLQNFNILLNNSISRTNHLQPFGSVKYAVHTWVMLDLLPSIMGLALCVSLPLVGRRVHEDMDRESKNIHILRQKYEESVFVNSLGPEVGPSVCKSPACKRLTVKLSVKCREHHFLMIRGYAIGSHL